MEYATSVGTWLDGRQRGLYGGAMRADNGTGGTTKATGAGSWDREWDDGTTWVGSFYDKEEEDH